MTRPPPCRPGTRGRRLLTLPVAVLAAILPAAPLPGGVPEGERDDGPPAPSTLQEPSPPALPGSELRVWLVTMGPGDAVWERFGHNALRILDPERGTDLSYNWGIFDFQQEDFIPRFLRGQMLYTMAPFPTGRMLQAYAEANREVVLQELELTPAQRKALQDFVEWNALPENRDYFYDYFLDNCSTRVRDVLDRVLDGLLSRQFRDAPTGTSYRTHIRRLTAVDPLLFTGMDLLLGSPGDRPISVWEEMFLPMTLRDAVRGVRVLGEDGVERPLVRDEVVAFAADRAPEPREPPRWEGAYLLLGLLLGGGIGLLGRAARRSRVAAWGAAALAGGWSLLAGAGGAILVAVLFTDHHFMYRNENLFQANPVSLAVAALVPVWTLGRGALPRLRPLALAPALLSLLGALVALLPWSAQDNTILVLLALPAHLGVALAFREGGRNTSRGLKEG